MQHNIKSLRTALQLFFNFFFLIVINNVQTGYSYLLAERSLLCLARCWILALGTAPSAEAESGHIGSWLPQLSFSLINEKMKCFQ